ncbi:hypothetical protein FisN_16Lh015 [Fistulifera solaris]|uniref:CBM6 domain-containing protein n=1 Tax=Fistulifera solaris TaxID=1519565 RepID=A0A1Z5KJT1_FISSO|nr:hypothetical protein FisN_16Lh015 [Fistulifera solaris]|eukprot:GAX26198.1 hypothetical protein FisN_16Lh015 [Fistulifera solaris]
MRVLASATILVITALAVNATCPYGDAESVRRRRRTQSSPQHTRQLQWGSQHPAFTSLISAADYATASFVQTPSTATVAVSSEGTKSVMNLQQNDWLRYVVGIPEDGLYQLSLRISSATEGGSVRVVSVDTRAVLATFSNLPSTADAWTTVSTNLTLPVGLHTIELFVDQGGWSLQWMNLLPIDVVSSPTVSTTMAPVMTPVSVTTSPTKLSLTTAPATLTSAPIAAPLVPVTPSVVIPMAPEAMPPLFTPVVTPVAVPLAPSVMVPVVTPVAAPVSTPIAPATTPVSVPATSILPPVISLDECNLFLNASDYASMSGVSYEAGTDYVGYLDSGDWVVYNLTLPAGTYQLDTMVASPEGMGSFLLIDAASQTPLMLQNELPLTGNWTTWQVASTVFSLPASTTTPFELEMKIYSDGWNLQSLCFRETTAVVPPFQIPGPPTMEPTTAATFTRTSSEAPVRPPHDCSSPF